MSLTAASVAMDHASSHDVLRHSQPLSPSPIRTQGVSARQSPLTSKTISGHLRTADVSALDTVPILFGNISSSPLVPASTNGSICPPHSRKMANGVSVVNGLDVHDGSNTPSSPPVVTGLRIVDDFAAAVNEMFSSQAYQEHCAYLLPVRLTSAKLGRLRRRSQRPYPCSSVSDAWLVPFLRSTNVLQQMRDG
jgi:hypothetical protein